MLNNEKRVCIIVGHSFDAQGSYNKTVGSEFEYNSVIAEMLSDVADIFYYDNFDRGYTNTIKYVMSPKTKDYDLIIELHFNSWKYNTANGAEGLYYAGNKQARKICLTFAELMHERFGSIVRGAKALDGPEDRGYACVAYQIPTTVMFEPFFCSGREVDNFDEPHEKEEYESVIREIISQFKQGKI